MTAADCWKFRTFCHWSIEHGLKSLSGHCGRVRMHLCPWFWRWPVWVGHQRVCPNWKPLSKRRYLYRQDQWLQMSMPGQFFGQILWGIDFSVFDFSIHSLRFHKSWFFTFFIWKKRRSNEYIGVQKFKQSRKNRHFYTDFSRLIFIEYFLGANGFLLPLAMSKRGSLFQCWKWLRVPMSIRVWG